MKEKAASLLEAARRELAKRKLKKAAKLMNEAVEADPDSHELLAERATMAITSLRTYREAVDDMSRAIAMAPEVGDCYDLRGQAYWYLREYERAFADFNKAIEADPNCARAYYHRGNFSEKLQRYESAIEDMKRAVELDPKNRSYRHRLDELKRTAIRHAERLGDEPPAVALEKAPAQAAPVEEPPAEAEPPAAEEEPVVQEEPVAAEAPAEAPPEEPEPAPSKPKAAVETAPVAKAVSEKQPKAKEALEQWSVRIPTGEKFGPVSMGVLKLWAEEQRIKPKDHLHSPKGAWVTAASVPEIAAIFENLRTIKKPPVRPD